MRDRHLNADGSEKRRMTHAEAIAAVRRFPEAERMNAYPCGGHWHVGHVQNQRENRGAMVRRSVTTTDPWAQAGPSPTDILRILFRQWVHLRP